MAQETADVIVIGGGPAGLSAALNLVRARRRTLVIDSNRPRNAATLLARGFLTRDGVSPLELRKLGRDEVERYDEGDVAFAVVDAVRPLDGRGFRVTARGVRGAADIDVVATAVVIASGLSESLPAIPSLRAYYGTHLHSCVECDGYEKSDAALALIGESDDLAERALLLSQWSSDLVVFTNGVGAITADDEARLVGRGVVVERRRIDDVEGERGVMTGIRLQDGTVVERVGGFVRPVWTPALDFADGLGLERDAEGLIVVDAKGRTSVPGMYAAGDSTPPGPQQLIVAAGAGAVVAATVNRDLIGQSIAEAASVLAAPSQ
ncbi:NAD(P)/FAD-dependent oxidoreductase [Diaminobutyricibacter tongyongensis]|uniref:NAD(P)/FAD-dependent oxidoreductase n=1 Tax=Leifsonia tongyongensis TaxID=1268043 RepID=A0A6L9XZK9_9MICO|nr:NAD(P)/FAD-dependent oxidoreductase [Diaminobutyricibacter tongyongensis]NEN06746.1 NAD(P)/FAD-dependent oxidoreductase [Diaminobutyricibacter tongyongensis]